MLPPRRLSSDWMLARPTAGALRRNGVAFRGNLIDQRVQLFFEDTHAVWSQPQEANWTVADVMRVELGVLAAEALLRLGGSKNNSLNHWKCRAHGFLGHQPES